ncbi:hypothetical protein [Leptolyngbya sp. 7M]|uniref:hypothetical protein n=1 Tax=Leptolyngbya sp. 7M TaxID=2812896 RepID=UPI001B8CAD19|nr:hypothetical protein [Leptolyngbya sp. 7M]QYO64187.1 hypothetical protein JVX88_31305 [Leptolyngbya sp. 7M]
MCRIFFVHLIDALLAVGGVIAISTIDVSPIVEGSSVQPVYAAANCWVWVGALMAELPESAPEEKSNERPKEYNQDWSEETTVACGANTVRAKHLRNES